MRKKNIFIIILFSLATFYSCQTIKKNNITKDEVKKNLNYNVIVSVNTIGIDNPTNDYRCFYKIFIDKIEVGRTTTGLESQNKIFKAKLSTNKHVLTLEKYQLVLQKKRYKKLNNIKQIKPNFSYFDIEKNKLTEIKIVVKNRVATFEISKK